MTGIMVSVFGHHIYNTSELSPATCVSSNKHWCSVPVHET